MIEAEIRWSRETRVQEMKERAWGCADRERERGRETVR